MKIWAGYIGLAVSFLVLASVLLWFLINTRGRLVVKTVLIAATVWYSLAVYFSVENLLGWPTAQSVPENSQLIAYRIKEPNPRANDPGAIYFWVNTRSKEGEMEQRGSLFNPKTFFNYGNPSDPRAYRLPYSKEMHKAIVEAQKQLQGVPGGRLRLKKRKGAGSKDRPDSQEESRAPLEFEIINPIHLFPKEPSFPSAH